uniref:Putative glycosyl transferase family 47 clade A protein 2 n=1 Tax=Coleochaete orbicularis TaxID=3124 RepID=A0A8F3BQH8_COLOB|nr:putative glycosyl transferase family 47 clade A protein 2 [Coleochaete orbicularis]
MGLGPSLAEEGVTEEEAKAYRDMVGDVSCWYFTHMKGDWASSEPIYHARMTQHPCRTDDPEKATVFYLPYYAALGLERVFSKKNSTLSNELPLAFTAWLAEQPYFRRNGGVDHFMAIGAGVWNLQQQNVSPQHCGLLDDPVTANMTKMSHDKDPWDRTTTGIPYPVFFHPSNDDQIRAWKDRVRSWPRKYRAAFIGSKSREGASFAFSSWRFSFRSMLLDECEGWDQCEVLDCHYEGSGGVSKCHRPRFPLQLSLDSDFCFQPAGDTMPRKSTFDGMIAGCIPVFFDEDSAATQYFWYLPANRSSYSVYINYEEVEKEGKDVVTFLKKVIKQLSSYTPEQIATMRNVILDNILPSLVTANPNDFHLNHFQDAVSRAVEKMMIKVARFKAGVEHQFPNPYLLTAHEAYSYQVLELPAPHESPA